MMLLKQHFSPRIANRFYSVFETDRYDPKEVLETWTQKKSGNLVLELYYKDGNDLSVYICDLYSWESKKQTETRILKAVTKHYADGTIGKDWIRNKDKLDIGKEVIIGEKPKTRPTGDKKSA